PRACATVATAAGPDSQLSTGSAARRAAWWDFVTTSYVTKPGNLRQWALTPRASLTSLTFFTVRASSQGNDPRAKGTLAAEKGAPDQGRTLGTKPGATSWFMVCGRRGRPVSWTSRSRTQTPSPTPPLRRRRCRRGPPRPRRRSTWMPLPGTAVLLHALGLFGGQVGVQRGEGLGESRRLAVCVQDGSDVQRNGRIFFRILMALAVVLMTTHLLRGSRVPFRRKRVIQDGVTYKSMGCSR
ncbi:hypothetical protein ACHAWF_000448, partial [Thalassiosira exigua]